MCNLYSMTKGQVAIRELARAIRDTTGNLPPLPGIFPDNPAPIVRHGEDGARELALARWGMPSPSFVLKGRSTDPGVTKQLDFWEGLKHRKRRKTKLCGPIQRRKKSPEICERRRSRDIIRKNQHHLSIYLRESAIYHGIIRNTACNNFPPILNLSPPFHPYHTN